MSLLKLEKVNKSYNNDGFPVPVLFDIDLEVEEGEYLVIMGPSGSGKSTLMNIIGCLDVPTSGDYYLDGEAIAGKTENQLADIRNKTIGFVFQTFHLLPKETAQANVALPLLYAGVPKAERMQRAKEALEKMGMGDRLDFYPNQLSGGQKQRVAIARAMVNHPKILLADEPTGALDTTSGFQIMELFSALNQEGITIIMITHEPEIAEFGKRRVLIRDGRILEGETEQTISEHKRLR
ncbi:MAG: ABC transporter ATP-binding protein [Lachnospiraceae bacterium]|nr:ABC transporter ATP-binding protein [Lachnospiraceae bacterium]